jgi:hypothetical protein
MSPNPRKVSQTFRYKNPDASLEPIPGRALAFAPTEITLDADEDNRGIPFNVEGGPGVADTPQIIAKRDNDTYTDYYFVLSEDTNFPSLGGGSGTPGGFNTQVQFNDSSSFGGDAGLTYDKTTDVLTAGGLLLGTPLAIAEGGTGADTDSGARTALGLAIGTNVQAHDADLDTIAGLTATSDNFMVANASAWASRTPTQARTHLALGNVDNTSDASKPVSSATQTALDLKANLASPTFTGTVTLPNNQTLTTPTISSYANAQHNHSNAAGGGAITGVVHDTGNETIAGTKTFSSPPVVTDSGGGANLILDTSSAPGTESGSLIFAMDGVPQQSLSWVNGTGLEASGAFAVPDDAYDAGWDGDFSVPTKNAVYDKIETVTAGSSIAIEEGNVSVGSFGTLDFDASDFTLTDETGGEVAIALAYGTGAGTPAEGNHDHAAVYQPLDSDLTTIAGLTATTDNFMVAASSAWASRTPAQAKTSLSLVKGDVGLGNVDNTSDAGKPVSTAQQTALDLKANLASPTFTGTVVFPSGQTIVTPTIVNFSNATHNHTNAAGGGQLTVAAFSDITSSAAELNALDGITSTVTELNYVDGVTSAIQTQLDGKLGTAAPLTQSVAMTFGDGTNEIADNTQYVFSIPVAHTLIRWRILAYGFTAGSTGSIVFDVWRDSFANFPHSSAQSISTSKPTLTTAAMAEDASITDWTEAGSAGDVYQINVDSCTTCTLVNLELWYTRVVE